MTVAAIRKEDTDGNRFYPHPITGDLLISVTTVFSATHGKPWLPPWAAKLAAICAVDNIELVLKTLQDEGRDAAIDLIKDEAKRQRDLKANVGTYVHDVAEALILWAASPEGTGRDIAIPTLPEHLVGAFYDDDPLEDVVDFMITGFTNFVAAFDPEFLASEMTVYNLDLGVAGTLDAILTLRGVALAPDGELTPAPGNRLVLCVDIKSGKHPEKTAQEQLAAYRRMKEAFLKTGEVVPMPATHAGAVLHLRPEHRDGFRLMPVKALDDAKAWNLFRRDVEICLGRAGMKPKPGKVAYPLNADGTMPARRIEDLDGEGYGRAIAPLVKHGLADVEDVAKLTAAGLLEVKGIGAKTADVVRQMLTDHGLTLADETTPIAEVA